MIVVISNQKGGVGKTTTAANLGVLLARQGRRVLLVDADPQFALTRQLGLEHRALGVNLVDVLAGRINAIDAVVAGVHGVDVIASGRDLAGVELSLVTEFGREHFLREALEPVVRDYDCVVVDTPPNLGLLTVNALVLGETVVAPVSAEDEESLHGICELRRTIARLAVRLDRPPLPITAIVARWAPYRLSSRATERALSEHDFQLAQRIPCRPALFAFAAAKRVPLALARPDSSPAIAYDRLAAQLNGSGCTMSSRARRSLRIDDPIGGEVCHVAHGEMSKSWMGRLRHIALDAIHPNPSQPRKHFDGESLAALAESIRERGLLQPIIVQRRGADAFELIAGERRWRAARIAGLQTIEALVADRVDATHSVELALIENMARDDLGVIEEARTIAALLDDLRIAAGTLARRLGRSRSDLVHTVRLLELPDAAIELIDAGGLSKGHGKALLTEPDHTRRRLLARRAADHGWSVRALEAEIAAVAARPPRRVEPHPDQLAAATTLHDVLLAATGCEIDARPHRAGYQVIMDQAALDRLVALLLDSGAPDTG